MREALAAIWGSVVLALTMFNRSINTVDIYVQWAEAEAQAFKDIEDALRKQRLDNIGK